MVSVCSGCDLYHPLTAGMLGSIAGILYLFTSALMVKLREQNQQAFDPRSIILIFRDIFINSNSRS